MGLSTVTISIEEFEDLIRCKRKLIEISKLKDENINIIYIANIERVLKDTEEVKDE